MSCQRRWTGIPVGQLASQGAAYFWFSHTGTKRRRLPVTIRGMTLRSIRVRSPISPPEPRSASQTSRWKAAMERLARPAFSFGLRATRSCQCSRSASTRKSSERPIFLRNTFRWGSSQSQSASPMGASLASAWLKPSWGPRKNTLPPTMPTSGRWPRTFSGVWASWPQMTAMPPAMNSPK